jgi:hypothetical protein
MEASKATRCIDHIRPHLTKTLIIVRELLYPSFMNTIEDRSQSCPSVRSSGWSSKSASHQRPANATFSPPAPLHTIPTLTYRSAGQFGGVVQPPTQQCPLPQTELGSDSPPLMFGGQGAQSCIYALKDGTKGYIIATTAGPAGARRPRRRASDITLSWMNIRRTP